MRSLCSVALMFLGGWFAEEARGAAETGEASVLGLNGLRGPVLFRHRLHEGTVNPDSAYPHRSSEGAACIGCHHKVATVTASEEFKACAKCHGPDRGPGNPEDKQGIELSAREISHRACIGCHRAASVADPKLF